MADNNSNEEVIRIRADVSGVDTALRSASNQMTQLQNQSRQVSQSMSNTFAKVDSSINASARGIAEMNTALNTASHALDGFDMEQMQKEIDKTRTQLDKLLARQDKMKATGVKSASQSFKNLQYDINTARDKLMSLDNELSSGLNASISDLQQQMTAIAGVEMPTAQYSQLETEAAKAKEELQALYEKQEQMRAAKDVSNTAKYKALQHNIEETSAYLQELQNKLASFSSTEMYSPEIAKYTEQIDALRLRIDNLYAQRDKMKDMYPGISRDADNWDLLAKQIDKVEQRIAALQSKKDVAIQAGDTSSIAEIEAAIRSARQEYDTLEKKIETIEFGRNGEVVGAFREIRQSISSATAMMTNLNSQIDVAKQIGSAYSSAYNQTIEKIQATEAELAKLKEKQEQMKAGGVNENTVAFANLRQSIAEAEAKVQDYNARLAEMQQKGEAFAPGTNSQAYAEAEAQLNNYSQMLSELRAANDDYIRRADTGYSSVFSNIAKSAQATGRTLTKTIGKNLEKSLKSAKKHVKSIIDSFKNLGKHSKDVDKLVKKMTKSFTSFFTTIKSRIRKMAIKAIFNDMKDTFKRISTLNDDFNVSISAVIDSMRALGAQMVAIVEPLVTKFGPLLSSLVDKLTSGADAVTQFLARLTGNQEYVKATKGNSNYAASLDDAADSANAAKKATDKYKESVLSFDEIHKLDAADADDALGIDKAGLEKAKTEATALNEIADNIYNSLKAGDFYGAGSAIADGINKAFAWLNEVAGWSRNATKLTKNLKNVVNAINGFVDNIDGKAIGEAVGDIVNTVINGFDVLVDPQKGIHFAEIGQKIGDMLIASINTIEWDMLGGDLVNAVQAGVKVINGALSEKIVDEATGETTTVGSAIGNALNDLFAGAISAVNPEDWGNLIANIINNITDMIIGFFSDTSKVTELAEKFAETINISLENIDGDDLASAITALANTLVDAFETLIDTINWGGIWDKLVSTLSSENFDWMKIIEAIGIATLPTLIVSTLTTCLGALGSSIASAAATIAGSPVVLTAVSAAFGLSGAAYGVNALVESVPTLIEQTNEVLYGDNPTSLKALDEMGAEFDTFGGAFGAALQTYLDSNKIIEDVNGEFVAFRGIIMDAQTYVDEVSDGVFMMNDRFAVVTDDMKALSDKLIAQGSAVDKSSSTLSETLDPAVSTASDSLNNFATELDAMSDRMSKIGTDTSDIIKTDYGDAYRSYSVPAFASGGVVGDGQLFIANEGGVAELIASDGSGNTAVVNNSQIISAVTAGVKAAVLEAGMSLSERMGAGNGSQSSGDIVLMADTIELARAVSKGNMQINRTSNHSVSFA